MLGAASISGMGSVRTFDTTCHMNGSMQHSTS